MKKHLTAGVPVNIPADFSEKFAEEFVENILEKRRTMKSKSAREKLDAVVQLMYQKGGLRNEHLKKYEEGKK